MIPFLHRFPASGGHEENPLWLIVLADMMTNLMLFFLVMFAMQQQGARARQELVATFDAADVVRPAPRPVEPPKPEFLEQKSAEELKRLFNDVTVTEQVIRVRLQDQLLFPSAQADLSSGADDTIAKLARVLQEMPNTVVVEGHTDDVPLSKSPYLSNWELSVARSYSVIDRLVALGVAPRRLVAAGYGEFHPAGANDTVEGRARNRRVEILIQRGKQEAAP